MVLRAWVSRRRWKWVPFPVLAPVLLPRPSRCYSSDLLRTMCTTPTRTSQRPHRTAVATCSLSLPSHFPTPRVPQGRTAACTSSPRSHWAALRSAPARSKQRGHFPPRRPFRMWRNSVQVDPNVVGRGVSVAPASAARLPPPPLPSARPIGHSPTWLAP